jgi:Cu-Zn family superoxide dismutase
MNKRFYVFILSTLVTAYSYADLLTVELFNQQKHSIGTIEFNDGDYGLLITPRLHDLPSGMHGFHIHEHADCGDHHMKAGGHLDPKATGTHLGPYQQGHLGDLPTLYVDQSGQSQQVLLAPRLKVKDLKQHAVMIHAGGDNYSNTPELGGGGARIGCGILSFP